MDVDVVLLNVQERDKWRLRVERLEATLADTRARRQKLQGRLRKIDRDLARLQAYSEALRDARATETLATPLHAPHDLRRVPR